MRGLWLDAWYRASAVPAPAAPAMQTSSPVQNQIAHAGPEASSSAQSEASVAPEDNPSGSGSTNSSIITASSFASSSTKLATFPSAGEKMFDSILSSGQNEIGGTEFEVIPLYQLSPTARAQSSESITQSPVRVTIWNGIGLLQKERQYFVYNQNADCGNHSCEDAYYAFRVDSAGSVKILGQEDTPPWTDSGALKEKTGKRRLIS
jgi:hypothetical protein